MVAFGFLPKNFGRWPGPVNGTFSFYECRLSGGGDTQTLLLLNLFEHFTVRGSEDTKTSILHPHAPLAHEPPCETFTFNFNIVYVMLCYIIIPLQDKGTKRGKS